MLGIISFVVSILGSIPYVYYIFKGRVRPERMTWGIWTVILILAVVSYQEAGAEESLWLLLGDLLITAGIFCISFFRGSGGLSKLDLVCLSVALVGLLLWLFSGSPLFQLVGALSADMIAVVPTIKKSLDDPMSDNPTTFAASAIASLLGIFSVGRWDITLLIYPIYLYTANFLTAVVIAVGRYQVRARSTH